jgi:hypothetical protein
VPQSCNSAGVGGYAVPHDMWIAAARVATIESGCRIAVDAHVPEIGPDMLERRCETLADALSQPDGWSNEHWWCREHLLGPRFTLDTCRPGQPAA